MLLVPFLKPVKTKILVLLSSSVERFGVSHMRDFFVFISTCVKYISLTEIFNINGYIINIYFKDKRIRRKIEGLVSPSSVSWLQYSQNG